MSLGMSVKVKGKWFRFYDGALDDPKIIKLTDQLFRTWVNVMAVASRNGGVLPAVDELALILRLSVREAFHLLNELESIELIDRHCNGHETVLSPHNWALQKRVSDCSTERVQRFRKRKRNGSSNVSIPLLKDPSEEVGSGEVIYIYT